MTARTNAIAMTLTTFGLLASLTLAERARDWVHAAPFIVGAAICGVMIFALILQDAS